MVSFRCSHIYAYFLAVPAIPRAFTQATGLTEVTGKAIKQLDLLLELCAILLHNTSLLYGFIFCHTLRLPVFIAIIAIDLAVFCSIAIHTGITILSLQRATVCHNSNLS